MSGERRPRGAALVGRAAGTPLGPRRWRVHDALVPMRDGVRLRTDVHRPEGTPVGTVLVRDPYGRRGVLPWFFTRPFVSNGYVVVYQSCRGTFGSEGTFEPARHEVADAIDTVAWMRNQPWYTGAFATLGGSYTGFTQWALRVDEPADLAASVIAVAPHDLARLVWDGGALRLDDMLGWTESVATQEDHAGLAALRHDLTRRRRIAPALAPAPVIGSARALLGDRAPWFVDWLTHPDVEDEYWAPHRLDGVLESTTAPVLLVGGWHDVMIRQTLEQHQRLTERGVETALTVGPWAHGPDLLLKGALRLLVQEALDWFDHHLRGRPLARRSAVRIKTSGGTTWHETAAWPATSRPTVVHLASGSGLGTRPVEGPTRLRFTHDPADPTPVPGGHALFPPSGPRDDGATESRPDVLVLTSAPLPGATTLLGEPTVTLHHTVDSEDAELHVRLCRVDHRGRSTGMADGHLRVVGEPGALHTSIIRLRPVAVDLAAGTRLRLVLSGTAHPAFASPVALAEPGDIRAARPRVHEIAVEPGHDPVLTVPTRS